MKQIKLFFFQLQFHLFSCVSWSYLTILKAGEEKPPYFNLVSCFFLKIYPYNLERFPMFFDSNNLQILKSKCKSNDTCLTQIKLGWSAVDKKLCCKIFVLWHFIKVLYSDCCLTTHKLIVRSAPASQWSKFC